MSAILISRRLVIVSLMIVTLLGSFAFVSAAEKSSDGRSEELLVTSPEYLLQVLEEGEVPLKEEIQALRTRLDEDGDAQDKSAKFVAELKIEVATLKASSAVQPLSAPQVERVLKFFAARRETIKTRMSELEKTRDELSGEETSQSASLETLETAMHNLRAMDEMAVQSPEMKKAYGEYLWLANVRKRLMTQLLQSTREGMHSLQTGKDLLDGIQPQLTSLEEAWKIEITKRDTRLSSGEETVNVWHAFLALPERVQGSMSGTIRSGIIGSFVKEHLAHLLGLFLVFILIGRACRWLSRVLRPRFRAWRAQTESVSLQMLWSLCETLVSSLFTIGFTLWVGLTFQSLGLLKESSARLILSGLSAVVAIRLSGRFADDFFSGKDAGGVLPFDKTTAGFYRRYVKLLAVYVCLGISGLYGAEALGFPAASRAFLRHLFETILQVWVLWLLRPSYLARLSHAFPDFDGALWQKVLNGLRGLVILLLTVVVLSDLLRYQGLSAYISQSLAYSEGVIVCWALLMLAARMVLHFLLHPNDGCLPRRANHEANVWRRIYGLANRAIGILLTMTAFLAVLLLWSLSTSSLMLLFDGLTWGVNLGPMRLTLLNLALVAMVIYLVGWCTRLGRALLETRVLPYTGWDSGIQYTISAVLEYFIVFLGGLVALNILGFPLANLALIAGALGVGVGFGLQDIVKNFVSGLILLFERPIKVGDMLVIDGQWGEVKAIRMRSTIFQTFDRYVLIIPNSEMVSSKILNWTHFGRKPNRLTLKVGVSYDSDVRQVTSLITEVCKANPRVLDDPAPNIFFSAYGDSSLDFTIWVHVRLPDDRTPATHEINSAIFEAFREHSIEIPFPQRDLHLRTWPESPRAPEGAKGGPAPR